MPPAPVKIFLNIPYVRRYSRLEDAIVAICTAYGLCPELAKNIKEDSFRMEKIKRAMRRCKYGITDISSKGFNMPYELGLLHLYKIPTLIMDNGVPDWYRYQKVFSDLLGREIERHSGLVDEVIIIVSNWIQANVKLKDRNYRIISINRGEDYFQKKS